MFSKNELEVMTNAFEKMDEMYRYQRYFYDFTRKYYLIGRDRLISSMKILDGERVLEIGCGTGRNLLILAKKFPNTKFFGLDASSEMLKTAELQSSKNINFARALADNFDYRQTFDLENPFDTIFFSYSLSMIDNWRQAIDYALKNLKDDGSFYIVDFYDQKDLPKFFSQPLKRWLKLFHVRYKPELLAYLEELEAKKIGKLEITPLARRYAYIVKFQKTLRPTTEILTES